MEITRYLDIPFVEASQTRPGDWVLIFARNKEEGSKANPKLKGTGATAFDVIDSGVEKTRQKGNPRIRTMRGSIAPTTIVKVTHRE